MKQGIAQAEEDSSWLKLLAGRDRTFFIIKGTPKLEPPRVWGARVWGGSNSCLGVGRELGERGGATPLEG